MTAGGQPINDEETMKTHVITKTDLDADNFYIGDFDPEHFNCNLEADGDLGRIKFKRDLRVQGHIDFPERTGIEVLGDIEARGGSITVGCGIIATGTIDASKNIKAGSGIQAGHVIRGEDISAGRSIISTREITAYGSLTAGEGIFSGRSIFAERTISCGRGITAGEVLSSRANISAGQGIQAGFYISCNDLSSELRIFAGICRFRLPRPEEMEIRVKKLVRGEIAFGTLVIQE